MSEKEFKRRGVKKRKSLSSNWRKPKGTDSKLRKEIKGVGKIPKPGYKRKKGKRGLHPSGYKEVLIHNVKDLKRVGEKEAVRIASKVGLKKKIQIVKKAIELDLKVLNPSNPKEWLENVKKGIKKKKSEVEEEKEEPEEEKVKEEEKVECPICGKKFKSERGMKIHKGRVHK